jgi:predicted ArsR family transcriptional regulator
MSLEPGETTERHSFLKGVVEFIAMHPDATIPEIVRSTGYSYTAVKHAIDELVEQGVLRSERRISSKRGRPASYFTLDKPFIVVSPPRQYLYFSKMIVEGLIEKSGVEGVKNFFSELGKKMGTEAAKALAVGNKKMSLRQYAQLIEKFFNDYGAFCKVAISGGSMVVSLHNCVFYEISKEYEGIVCEAHNTFFKSFLETLGGLTLMGFSHEKCMARGDRSCVFKLQIQR